MHLNQLRYFITLVDKHSFTEAAHDCFITQSALSQQIKALEKELSLPLLSRKGRTFDITPAGKLLYQKAHQLLKEIAAIEAQMQWIRHNQGYTLRLGLLSSMDKEKLPEQLKTQVLNRMGFDLELLYGSHDELYDLFGNGSVTAFISDSSRLFNSETFARVKLFSSKIYAETSRNTDLKHTGLHKLKLAASELQHLKLLIVCAPEHLEAERASYDQFLQITGTYQAVSSLAEGRKLLQQSDSNQYVLLLDRSLMRGDSSNQQKILRYELQRKGKSIKRHLCCYAKKNLSTPMLNELCAIVLELGAKSHLQFSQKHPYQDKDETQLQTTTPTPEPEPSYPKHSIPL